MKKLIENYNGNGNDFIVCETKEELKSLRASKLEHGDIVKIGKHYIHIRYGTWEEPDKYNTPSLCSFTELENGKRLDSFPGTSYGLTPYFIDNFLHT